MEAIEPGSSNSMGSPTADSYEIVSPLRQGDAYSYIIQHTNLQEVQQSVIYDEPDTTRKIQATQQASYPSSSSLAMYDDVIQTSTQPQSHSRQKMFNPMPGATDSGDEGDEVYENLPDDSDLYEAAESTYIETEAKPTMKRSTTFPRTLESISEVTLENLTNLDQKQAQLWMLLQMQKMVQKMEDVYEPLKPSANNQPKAEHSISAHSPVFHPPQETEEEYDDDIGCSLADEQQPDRPDLYVNLDSLQIADDQQPTRQELYINLDSISEVLTGAAPPPIPPKTYRELSGDAIESISHGDRTQSELPVKWEPNVKKSDSQELQQSKTFSDHSLRTENFTSPQSRAYGKHKHILFHAYLT